MRWRTFRGCRSTVWALTRERAVDQEEARVERSVNEDRPRGVGWIARERRVFDRADVGAMTMRTAQIYRATYLDSSGGSPSAGVR